MNNQEILLNVALELFTKRGYEGIGTQEIVEKAGVTKPTLYHYFSSKNGLLQALLEREFAPLHSALITATSYDGDLTLTLEKIMRVYFSFAEEHPCFYRLQLGMSFAPIESESYQAVNPFHVFEITLMQRLFDKASRDHGNMRGRETTYAATFLGMINTYLRLALNGQIDLNDSLVFKARHQFMHGIFS